MWSLYLCVCGVHICTSTRLSNILTSIHLFCIYPTLPLSTTDAPVHSGPLLLKRVLLNTLRPKHYGRHFADNIFKCIFLKENLWISLKISLNFVHRVRINRIPALVQIMAGRRIGDKPLSGSMMVSLLRHSSGLSELTRIEPMARISNYIDVKILVHIGIHTLDSTPVWFICHSFGYIKQKF